MKFVRAVSCWANEASPLEAIALAEAWGFEALEGPFSADVADIRLAARNAGLELFAEISTCCPAGTYVPDLRATPTDHLEDFRRKLDTALALEPIRITVLTGNDFWDFSAARDFYQELLAEAAAMGAEICVETHRSRPTFHPLRTARLLAELPELTLTLDVSHWCVVCERALGGMTDLMLPVEKRVGHIHARVGYDQGPQVPDPESPWHRDNLLDHLACWKRIARCHEIAGNDFLTFTPEFGPDGYLQICPVTGKPVADLRTLNRRMGALILGKLGTPV